VTDTAGRNIDEVALARTNDGTLHVLWRGRAGSTETIKHAPVSKAGAVGQVTTAVSGFNALGNPDVAVRPDGSLQLFVGAIRSGSAGIHSATAGAPGTTWSAASRVSTSTTPGDPGAALGADGTPFFVWAAGTNMWAHLGPFSGGQPPEAEPSIGPTPQCCFYDPEVAVDRTSGDVYTAFYSNVSNQNGLFVQRIHPSQGPRQLAPGAVTNGDSIQPGFRTAFVARDGGGVFLAYCTGYPSCTRVVLWRVGTGSPLVVAAGTRIEDVNLANGPDGRLWLMWQDSSKRQVFAARTNAAATRVGAVVAVAPPPRTSTVWKLGGQGSLGPLDLLAHVSTPGSIASWHTQVPPGLSLKCSSKKLTVTCAVTDAGSPVAGAAIKLGGKTVTTGVKGTASTSVAAGRVEATASKAGYAAATVTLRVAE